MKRLWNETLTLLAVVFLVAYSYPAFVSQVSPGIQNLIDIVQWICWGAFVLDLIFGIVNLIANYPPQ